MRIGFDAKRAFLNSSGLGNYSRNTINALQKYFPEEKLVLFTPKTNDRLFPVKNSYKLLAPAPGASKLYQSYWRTFKLSGEIAQQKLDVFHGLSNELPKGIQRSGAVSVVTIHDLIFKRFPEYYSPIDRRIYTKKVKTACQSADKIIAISKQTKNDIVDILGIAESKIELVYQCISPLFFNPKFPEKLISRIELPEDFILSVGTLEPRKNQLQTLKAVFSKGIKNPLVFVGNETGYKKELDAFISAKKMKNKILFLSNLAEIELAQLYSKAAVSVYISVYEGFGLPVIEAMASGCPVITSNVSCLPETAGGAAILNTPLDVEELGNNIHLLLNDENRRNELIKKGLERAKEFHPRKYSENLISLYSEISK